MSLQPPYSTTKLQRFGAAQLPVFASRWVYFVLSFLVTAFAQPAWVPWLGYLAGAFGYALFWKGLLGFRRRRDRFLLAALWFSLVQGVQLSWMATTDYMGPLIYVLYLFLILGMGVQFGILSFLVSPWMSIFRMVAVSGCWVVFEWLRLYFFCGFTWNQIGLALAGSHYSLQFASVCGIFGLSFWVLWVNLWALKAWTEKCKKLAFCWGALACFPYLFGWTHQWVIERTAPVSKKLEVLLIQTGLFPEQKDLFLDMPEAYLSPLVQWQRILHVLDGSKKADLILFPEAALPLGAHVAGYALDDVKHIVQEDFFPPLESPFAIFSEGQWKVNNGFILQALANQHEADIIVGLDDRDWTGKYNAAFHFVPWKNKYSRYEKQILVPIGEYIPASQFRRFSQFVSASFGVYSSFDPGKESKIFHSHVPIGISICLEETFGHLIRRCRLLGAELFVNITNDVWFPHSKLPEQHFHHGRVRSVENGVPILRSCNTGITGAIDCFGRVVKVLPKSETQVYAMHLTLPMQSYRTLYSLWGDAGILTISSLGMILYLLRKSCRKCITRLIF